MLSKASPPSKTTADLDAGTKVYSRCMKTTSAATLPSHGRPLVRSANGSSKDARRVAVYLTAPPVATKNSSYTGDD